MALIDKLAEGHEKLLAFDCEFWNIHHELYTPREMAGFFLIKKNGKWSIKKEFFVTFLPPKGHDVSFVSATFASVNPSTTEKLVDLERKLSKPWFESFVHSVPKIEEEFVEESIRIYNADPYIKEHRKPITWLHTFLKDYSDSIIIVKGTGDIECIQYACKLNNLTYSPPKGIYDIALWNKKSHRLCGTAKLEGTYKCIEHDFNDEIKEFAKLVPIEKAHNPLTDASMTFLVALYMIQIKKK